MNARHDMKTHFIDTMIINKVQNQMFKQTGVNLGTPLLSNGMLYVAPSCIHVHIHTPEKKTKNIVCKDVL